MAQRFGNPFPPVWSVPHRSPLHFVGRQKELQLIADTLSATFQVSLGGTEGIGKTALAIVYAYAYRSQYDAVIWIDCQNSGLDPIETLEQTLRDASSKKALVIFDNAESTELASQVHASQNCHALTVARSAVGITLGPLPEDEGAELVLRRSGILSLGDSITAVDPTVLARAKVVSTTFGGVPYWLRLSGQYVEETGGSLRSFVSYLAPDNLERFKEILQNL